jgi:hypothetical protein
VLSFPLGAYIGMGRTGLSDSLHKYRDQMPVRALAPLHRHASREYARHRWVHM